jgi:hydrogenase maturation protease
MNFDGAEKIAAAILYEGYILYPYRPTAIKNRQRWNFGTLYPRVYATAQRPQEPFRLIAECLAVADAKTSLDVRISFLQLVPTQNAGELTDPSLAWDEAVERTSEHANLRIADLMVSPLSLAIEMETAGPSAPLRSGRDDNSVVPARASARIPDPVTELSSRPERTWISCHAAPTNDHECGFPQRKPHEVHQRHQSQQEILGSGVEGPAVQQNLRIELTIIAETLQDGVCKLHLEVQNTTPLPSGAEAKREEALPLSFVSAHLLLGIHGGEFVSLLDPDPAYREAVAACCNTGVFPVLVGEEPERPVPARRGDMMFCSPIILYDYPKIAPESEGDFFDGTEMDEMLTLRVLTLTDAEKQEMRSGDPRARKILERTEALTSESMLKAHGVIRGLREIRGGTE